MLGPSSLEADIDVGRPKIDVSHCCKKLAKLRKLFKVHAEMANHIFERFQLKKCKDLGVVLLRQRKVGANCIIPASVKKKNTFCRLTIVGESREDLDSIVFF